MIEEILYNYLKEGFSESGVGVYLMRPENVGERYIVIEKTGSAKENRITRAVIAIQSYAGSLFGAASLNESVKRFMENAIRLDTVSGVKLNSDYNFTDTRAKQPRYQCVYEVTYYQEVANE